MKQSIVFCLTLIFSVFLYGQTPSTAIRVYEIFQDKCASCHSHNNPQAGLDLEGTGNTKDAKAAYVYNKIVGVSAKNNTAAAKGYQLIHPGRVDKSFLFKKINQGLDRDMVLENGENEAMPLNGSLTDVEKELVRQWILFGAPKEDIVVKETLLMDYYNNGMGRASFPEGAPPAPNPSEGIFLIISLFTIIVLRQVECLLALEETKTIPKMLVL